MQGIEGEMRSLVFFLLAAFSCLCGAYADQYSPEDSIALCSQFRRLNELGKSYRVPEFLAYTRVDLVRKGYAQAQMLHAEEHDAAARDFFCPDVW